MSSMRQAITVRYHGPTARRDARLSTTTASGIRRYWPLRTLPGDTDSAYREAAERMRKYMQGDTGLLGTGWEGKLQGGWTGLGVAVFTLLEAPCARYAAMLAFIERNLDAFMALRDLKRDIKLEDGGEE